MGADLYAWFDTDPQYVATATGPLVSSWTSRAGSGGLVATEGIDRPDYVAGGLDGQHTVEFNGSTHRLRAPVGVDTPASGPFSLYMVAANTAGSFIIAFTQAGVGARFFISRSANNWNCVFNSTVSGSESVTAGPVSGAFQLVEMSALIAGNLTRLDQAAPVNGVQSGGLSGTLINTLDIGHNNGVQQSASDFAEIVCTRGRTAEQDVALRAYFAQRWPTLP